MQKRGRVSSAALSVVQIGDVMRRPGPPPELTDEQAVEWREVVNRLPAEWFGRETHGMLVQYCRHIVAARRVAQLVRTIEAEPDFDIVAYDRALRMQEKESRAISSLATRMRISQQSQYDKSKKKPNGGVRPWGNEVDVIS